VRLPVASGDAPARYRAMPSPAVPATGLRILVIDDNVDSAETMTLFLRCQGHDVRLGGDGLEAVRIADQFRPDVILLDIGLPGLSGYEVARTIRLQAWAREICLTAVSGWSQETDRARSRDAGFDHHLVKPVDPDVPACILASAAARAMVARERRGAPAPHNR
jgi:CheY-like chemotaxis protein